MLQKLKPNNTIVVFNKAGPKYVWSNENEKEVGVKSESL
jgi:hypothetical protein